MNAIGTLAITTTEQLLALGEEDGFERHLIRGQLWEKPKTRRNPRHSRCEARIAFLLIKWLHGQPKPRGEVLSGEAGFRLRSGPDTTVGIDVAYISAELARKTPRSVSLVDGVPILAVEILSPSDQHEEITAKIEEYLACGVSLVWKVDPDFRTVTIYRPGKEPELVNMKQELSAEPELPGFRVPVAEIFED